MSDFYDSYPSEPIGGGNPSYRCSYCGVSDPEINGRLEGHGEWCEWRQHVEQVEKLRTVKERIAAIDPGGEASRLLEEVIETMKNRR